MKAGQQGCGGCGIDQKIEVACLDICSGHNRARRPRPRQIMAIDALSRFRAMSDKGLGKVSCAPRQIHQ